jgi:undecaprenyl-diphosphatase
VAFIGLNFGKKGFYWGIGFLCTVALTDLIGTYIFKQSFQRLRPCQDPFFFTEVRLLLKQCSGSYSFVSNHAANHFGLATFMVLTFRHMFKGWIFVLYLWAVMIAYAQVYVGVHYPLDVICGGMLGAGIGWLTAWFYHHNFGFISLEH